MLNILLGDFARCLFAVFLSHNERVFNTFSYLYMVRKYKNYRNEMVNPYKYTRVTQTFSHSAITLLLSV